MVDPQHDMTQPHQRYESPPTVRVRRDETAARPVSHVAKRHARGGFVQLIRFVWRLGGRSNHSLTLGRLTNVLAAGRGLQTDTRQQTHSHAGALESGGTGGVRHKAFTASR